MLSERPLTGIGLDNYRLIYGSRAGLSLWDQDFNATNVYLEILVGIGIAGVLLFVVGALAAIRIARRALLPGTRVNLVAAIVLVAFAVHGVFDSFITFSTAMYLTSSVVALGLWQSDLAEWA
jgi:O-antigen ligase